MIDIDVPPRTPVVPGRFIRNRYDSCCFCGHRGYVEADHVRPVTAGGRSVPVNLAPLCAMHNLAKADFWSVPGAPPRLVYHPFRGLDDIRLAWAVLHTEIGWLEDRFDHGDIITEIWAGYGYPSGLGGWAHRA